MFYCYIIHNEQNRTYNGYTNNLERRLRQHNGLIKGGARATHGRGPWNFVLIVTSEHWDCISVAMQHEWSIKYPTRKRPRPREYEGTLGRLNSMKHVFDHMQEKGCKDVSCYIQDGYHDMFEQLTSNYDFIDVFSLDTLNKKI